MQLSTHLKRIHLYCRSTECCSKVIKYWDKISKPRTDDTIHILRMLWKKSVVLLKCEIMISGFQEWNLMRARSQLIDNILIFYQQKSWYNYLIYSMISNAVYMYILMRFTNILQQSLKIYSSWNIFLKYSWLN